MEGQRPIKEWDILNKKQSQGKEEDLEQFKIICKVKEVKDKIEGSSKVEKGHIQTKEHFEMKEEAVGQVRGELQKVKEDHIQTKEHFEMKEEAVGQVRGELQKVKEDHIQTEEHLQKKEEELEQVRAELQKVEEDHIQTEEDLKKICFQMKTSHEVDVTLDKDTAHCKLKISDDGKQVQWIEEGVQNVSNETRRFDTEPFVLGTVVRSLRSYWRVNVEGKDDWVLGVAEDGVSRKGQLTLSPSEGFWVIRVSNGRTVKALTEEVDLLTGIDIPKIVGVYLDCEEHEVSFYNAENGSHIYTFKDGPSYNKTVRPIFSPLRNDPVSIKVLFSNL